MNQVLPLPNMPKGTYYLSRKGKLKFWRNLPMKFQWRKHCKQIASRTAYMSLQAVSRYRLSGISEYDELCKNSKKIDGFDWVPTDFIKSIMSLGEFREMECHVTTWIPDPNITDEMREQHRQEQAEFEWECGGYSE